MDYNNTGFDSVSRTKTLFMMILVVQASTPLSLTWILSQTTQVVTLSVVGHTEQSLSY